MSILEPLALNWFQCQIRLVLILGYNTKVIVWMQMKLLDGIKEQAREGRGGEGERLVLHGLGHGDGEDRHRSSVRPAARGPRRRPDLARRPRRRPDLELEDGASFFSTRRTRRGVGRRMPRDTEGGGV